jgi:hypothetical protein
VRTRSARARTKSRRRFPHRTFLHVVITVAKNNPSVSGLYHDFVWYCIFYDIKDEDGNCINNETCYDQQFGRVTLFFAYVGLVMLLERPVGKLGAVQWLSKHLPTAVIAHLLLLIHLPLGYW